jgi:hypothetical protein
MKLGSFSALKALLGQAAMFAALMVERIQAHQFRHGTPPRSRMHVHDRADGPNSRTSIHMLVRSVNKGYDYKPSERELRPHGRASERGWQCAKRRPSLARREALSLRSAAA